MTKQFTSPAALSSKPYVAIPMVAVQSNQVGAVGYDPATSTLAVSFARGAGAIYHYTDVSPELYAEFMAAESKGTFFGKRIKPLAFEKFPAPAVGIPTAPPPPPAPAVTPAVIAAKLNGTEYPVRGIQAIADEARAAGIVIVYGASDDLMEFDGAVRDEVYACGGATVPADAKGPLPDWENVKDQGEAAVAAYIERKKSFRTIEAVWCPKGLDASWAYETDIPHSTFDVMEDGGLYCRGIVFALADLVKITTF